MNINLSMNTWPIVIKDTMILLNLLLLFRHHVMSKSLPFHRLQHSRLPCPSPSPGVSSNSCPLCLWCHQIISSSGIQFSSCPASFPASGSFPVSQLLASALCIRWPKYWSFTFNISHSNEYAGLISFRIDWFDILAAPGTLRSLLHSLLGFSVHEILQAKILKWVAIPFYRASSWPQDWAWVSCIAGRFFSIWAIRQAPLTY